MPTSALNVAQIFALHLFYMQRADSRPYLAHETGGLSMWGWGIGISRGSGETVARSTDIRRTRCSGDPGFSGAVSAIRRKRCRCRNNPQDARLRATVTPLSPPPRHLHQVQTDASVTNRPPILTPAQRVGSHLS
jgi:hypothetical protein